VHAISGIEPSGDKQAVYSLFGDDPLKFLPAEEKVLGGVLAVLESPFLRKILQHEMGNLKWIYNKCNLVA